jgi:hypothetical protein
LNVQVRRFEEEVEGETVTVKRWCKIVPFNPRSTQQVLDYIKWKVREAEGTEEEENWYVPVTIKEGKETTEKDHLAELAESTGDEFLGVITQHRSLRKMLSNDIPNWKPRSETGCVHTTWNYAPPQGQIASRRPNVQNCSKHTETGQEFRGIIEAPEGYVFVEADYRSFHVATMGYRANDPTYIRFSQLDPHSIFASYLDGIPKELAYISFDWDDERILAVCKEIKKHFGVLRQKVAKPAVLGNQLGLGPHKLWKQNKKYIHSLGYAIELQGRLSSVFPLPAAHKDTVRETAHKQTYLRNDWGGIQYFYNVFNWVWNKKWAKWDRRNGDDSEKCIAFDVQSAAFGRIKDGIIKCEELGFNEKYRYVNTIHDSVIYMPRKKDVDRCIRDIKPIYEAPCPVLRNKATGKEGLRVMVEVSVGRNWKKWDGVGNPDGMREVKC